MFTILHETYTFSVYEMYDIELESTDSVEDDQGGFQDVKIAFESRVLADIAISRFIVTVQRNSCFRFLVADDAVEVAPFHFGSDGVLVQKGGNDKKGIVDRLD